MSQCPVRQRDGGQVQVLDAAVADDRVAAVVLCSGLKVFSAGADASWMAQAAECSGERLSSEEIAFARPEGEITMTLVMAEGAGLVDFAIIPPVEYDDHQDVANAEKWAARLPVPAYAIDDQTAVTVTDGTVEVVSEGRWKLFSP